MLNKEREYYSESVKLIAGVDEAGRGPLAGPVVAAAVIFPPSYQNEEINDSKKLTEKKRKELYEEIKKNAIAYGVAFVSAEEIDRINIYEATKVAMKEALRQLNGKYDLIITDAMKLDMDKPVIALVKGDAKCLNVAGASILAKVTRDRYLKELDEKYPEYKFAKHKGYGTKDHLEALKTYGPIEGVHRKSFRPVREIFLEQMKLF